MDKRVSIFFDLTGLRLKPMIYHTQGEHINHNNEAVMWRLSTRWLPLGRILFIYSKATQYLFLLLNT